MSALTRQEAARSAQRTTLIGIVLNGSLAAVKAIAGIVGNSYALVADAIESFSDVLASVIVWVGLRIAASPPTERHPFGKGRAEAIAAVIVSLALFGAAAAIAISSVREIRTPHHAPAPFTLLVLVLVVLVKEGLFRYAFRVGDTLDSTAVKTDAWHHRSDAVTSLAAFVGISIALVMGPGYESADDWAALIASGIIAFNAYHLIRPALSELTDVAPNADLVRQVRAIAEQVEDVHGTHRCWVRKLGFDHYVELDVLVDGDLSVREGHDIAHRVHEAIRDALPMVTRVMVHVEPVDEYGRHKLDWEA
jgi:cation diffusion facilitator family transporter